MITLEFDTPKVANFIQLVRNNTPFTIPLQDLTEEEVKQYIEIVTNAIWANWKKKITA